MRLTEMVRQLLADPDTDGKRVREVFRLERGSYFDGRLCYWITEEEDGFWFHGEGTDRFALMPEYRFRISGTDLDQLAEYVLPAKGWPADDRDPFVLDGYSWHLHFDHKELKVHASGYMRFPAGYRVTVGNLQLFIETLCLTYAGEEYDYGWENRIEF